MLQLEGCTLESWPTWQSTDDFLEQTRSWVGWTAGAMGQGVFMEVGASDEFRVVGEMMWWVVRGACVDAIVVRDLAELCQRY